MNSSLQVSSIATTSIRSVSSIQSDRLTNREDGNEPREGDENGYSCELALTILSMNKYLLVVTPGLEHLLRDEISSVVNRLGIQGTAMKMLKGGIEVACNVYIA